MNLSKQELNTILEALEAWESKDLAGELIESILTAALGKSSGQQSFIEQTMKPMKAKRAEEAKVRKERSVLLRAKLIGIRDAMEVDQLFDEATSGKS